MTSALIDPRSQDGSATRKMQTGLVQFGEALADLRMVLALDPDGDYGARAAYIIDLVDQKKD